MEADTLTRIDITTQINNTVYSDSTALMFNEWNYSGDATPLLDTKTWLQDTIQAFHQRQSLYYPKHDGIVRSNRIMSESILLIILILEIALVAFLIKNSLKFINKTVKRSSGQDDWREYSEDVGRSHSSHEILWLISVVVFALMIPVLLNFQGVQANYDQDNLLFFRYLMYVLLYFFVKFSIYRMVGMTFFSINQTRQWITVNKTMISFYALILSPVLILAEVGLPVQASFVYAWIIVSIILARIWQLINAVDIFSIKIGDFLYLILYLCGLEILPILLFYKGLFLI
ncbi:MAG: DUF4271 domain-containing protein [Bacteroidales bacterium]|nr:DUF4271 domain-containing protein [Bacteroidales bacterium]